ACDPLPAKIARLDRRRRRRPPVATGHPHKRGVVGLLDDSREVVDHQDHLAFEVALKDLNEVEAGRELGKADELLAQAPCAREPPVEARDIKRPATAGSAGLKQKLGQEREMRRARHDLGRTLRETSGWLRRYAAAELLFETLTHRQIGCGAEPVQVEARLV